MVSKSRTLLCSLYALICSYSFFNHICIHENIRIDFELYKREESGTDLLGLYTMFLPLILVTCLLALLLNAVIMAAIISSGQLLKFRLHGRSRKNVRNIIEKFDKTVYNNFFGKLNFYFTSDSLVPFGLGNPL